MTSHAKLVASQTTAIIGTLMVLFGDPRAVVVLGGISAIGSLFAIWLVGIERKP